MTAITIDELHQQTALWVRKAAVQELILLTDNGQPVAKIVPIPATSERKPFLNRKLLPGFAQLQRELSGGTESTEAISEMRDGR